MTQRNINSRKTDVAWSQLYARLEKDGLLTDGVDHRQAYPLRPVAFKWAAAVVTLCLSITAVYHMALPGKQEKALLSLHNTQNATTLVTTLEDGSMVYLGDDTRLNYPESFEKDKREVTLQGDALFEVSGNKERPFLIEAGVVRIEVLGTSFHVKNTANSAFELSVKSGQVKVTHKKSGQISYVQGGETVRLLTSGLQVSASDWLREYGGFADNVYFKDVRLSEIIRVINQNNPGMQLAVSSALESRIITYGWHHREDPEIIAESLCVALNTKFSKDQEVIFIYDP